MAEVRLKEMCRGAGLGYLLFEAGPGVLMKNLVSSAALPNGSQVPTTLIPIDATGLNSAAATPQRFVVVVPLLNENLKVSVSHRETSEELCSHTFSTTSSRLSSRLLTLSKPEIAHMLRGVEQRQGLGTASLEVRELWPDDDEVIWRVQAQLPGIPTDMPIQLSVRDGAGQPLAAQPIVMEDHQVPSDSTTLRIMTFSVRLPQSCEHALFEAYTSGDLGYMAFTCVIPPNFHGMLAHAETLAGAAYADQRYGEWFASHRVSTDALELQRQHPERLGYEGLISLVMPTYQADATQLASAIDSVIQQTYPHWELVIVDADSGNPATAKVLAAAAADKRIKVIDYPNRSIAENTNCGIAAATGSYIGFLDHDDLLEPDALWHYAAAIAAHPTADLLYCDEDRLITDVAGQPQLHAPAFKTDFDLAKLRSHNYVTHLLMVSRRMLELTERTPAELSGAQDYDLTLKAVEVAQTHEGSIIHIPRVLYHWRESAGSTAGDATAKPFAHEAGKQALVGHLERVGLLADVSDGPLPFSYQVSYALPDSLPHVSIVIPSKDHAGLLSACVRSILERTDHPSFDVTIVENGSTEPETFALYDELQADERVQVITWPDEGAREADGFNYSALVNFGVAHTSGETLLLLNNDTQVLSPGWFTELLRCLQRPEVGVVGAKLLYEDGLIQHAGMMANPNGDFAHTSQNLPADALGYGYSVAFPSDVAMVTGACQMIRRELFDQLGGYDEEHLGVGFNDGDFCLRARELGYVCTYTPFAVLRHREFSSRGRETADTRLRQRYLREKGYFMSRHAAALAAGVAGLNPNLDGFSPYYQLGW